MEKSLDIISELYFQIPRFTRYWLTTSIILNILCGFDILPIEYMFLSRKEVLDEFQLWRLVTSPTVFYPQSLAAGLHLFISCYLIIRYTSQLEKVQFRPSPADYLYLLVIMAVFCNVIGLIMDGRFLMDPMFASTIHVWCRLQRNTFKVVFMPVVLTALEYTLKDTIASLIGILIGEVYYIFKFKVPQLGGISLLGTPYILKKYVPDVHT